jgi:cobalamin synthase
VLARVALPFELWLARPATPGRGLFATLGVEVGAAAAIGATICGGFVSAPAVILVPDLVPALAPGLALVVVVTALWHALWRTKVGGSTGDVCGAAIELRELGLLFVFGVATGK